MVTSEEVHTASLTQKHSILQSKKKKKQQKEAICSKSKQRVNKWVSALPGISEKFSALNPATMTQRVRSC